MRIRTQLPTHRRLCSALTLAMCLLAGTLVTGTPTSHAADDPRAFMHGIGTARAPDGAHYIFYSASGLPPRGADADGSWPHDVYVSTWQPASGTLSAPQTFISRPEAQEPVSVAQHANGTIMLTFEDGFDARDVLTQRFGLYGQRLEPIKAYPQDILSGGHSGHIAAVADGFVVFYSEGWVPGGGVDNLGSGDNVHAAFLDTRGRIIRHVDVASGKRAWWPVLAGAPDRALLVWQQFVRGRTDASLHAALMQPATGKLVPLGRLLDKLNYYTYQVAWMPAVNRFLLTGTRQGDQGFARLISPDGKILAQADCLPATVREAEIMVRDRQALIPAAQGQVISVDIGEQDALHITTLSLDARWGTTGTLGLPGPDQGVTWFTLTEEGMRHYLQKAALSDEAQTGKEPARPLSCATTEAAASAQ
ncbi:hypothetical protein FXN63_20370 [Pigmentiphaga aceris]|uniref:Uncharacterized protein n=1 Tax=Pigmentiphaga aceris TaxID=1940612 RepID=A0A5C0AZP2_9BURK|nr:hypothetical protein [Pigmentiphaga aceris]QEI07932.1 hypothetical protein FXN63_20370 [Pigmentiphaga aceris]